MTLLSFVVLELKCLWKVIIDGAFKRRECFISLTSIPSNCCIWQLFVMVKSQLLQRCKFLMRRNNVGYLGFFWALISVPWENSAVSAISETTQTFLLIISSWAFFWTTASNDPLFSCGLQGGVEAGELKFTDSYAGFFSGKKRFSSVHSLKVRIIE